MKSNKILYIVTAVAIIFLGLYIRREMTGAPKNEAAAEKAPAGSEVTLLMDAMGMNYLEDIEIAPNFILESLEGAEIELQELEGNTFLLSFWATW